MKLYSDNKGNMRIASSELLAGWHACRHVANQLHVRTATKSHSQPTSNDVLVIHHLHDTTLSRFLIFHHALVVTLFAVSSAFLLKSDGHFAAVASSADKKK